MTAKELKFSGLSGNQLKIIALVTMTIDHIGKQIFPQYIIFSVIGRLAFPIFAFMIAEGCRYTRNRRKYLLSMAVLGLICQIVYFAVMGSLYQCVLITFSLSIWLIYVLDDALKRKTAASSLLAVFSFAAVFFICEILPQLLTKTDFAVDYGIWGVMLPVFVYMGRTRKEQLGWACIGLTILCLDLQGIQWFSLAALLLLGMYSGKRGRLKLKYLFYVYYPLHLAAIYAVDTAIRFFFEK